MIQLLTTPEEIDAVFLNESVREDMGLPADWSGANVLERGCRVWGFDGGAFIVSPQPDGRAQLHVAVLPEARGQKAVDAARAALACEIAAGMRVYGCTPKHRPDALAFAFAAGMSYAGENEHEWITEPMLEDSDGS